MNKQDEPRDLLDELETLQRVLDDAASDQVDQAKAVPVIDSTDDIPVLNDLFDSTDNNEPPILKPEAPILKAVPAGDPAAAPQKPQTFELPTPQVSSGNPFLPQSILDRLAQEREAAQFSAEQAHQTMQKIMASRPNDNDQYENEKNVTPLNAQPQPGTPASDASDFSDALSAISFDDGDDEPVDIIASLGEDLPTGDVSGVEQLLGELNQAATPDADASEPNTRTGDSSQNKTPSSALTELQKAEIVEDLVAEMLPKIEAQLRARLKALL